jgi:type VI secretion system protein ImpA
MNVEQLLEPISDDQPAGGDFEYDPAFGELERASQGKPSQELGDSVSEGEPPEWQVVVSGAESLLGQTKDLRLAVYTPTDNWSPRALRVWLLASS